MRRPFKILAVILAIFVILSLIGQRTGITTPVSPIAMSNTWYNAFVSSCKTQVDKNIVDPAKYCGCALNRLIDMHPRLDTDKKTLDRITSEGLDQTETDSLITCVK